MPNGESRNWIRFLLTLESFNILYGTWPTQICLYPFFIAELQQKLSKEDFQVLQAKIRLVPDEGNPFFPPMMLAINLIIPEIRAPMVNRP